MSDTDAFDGCDYYDCADPEDLTWTEPAEAIESFIDGFLSPNMTTEEIRAAVEKHCPLVVTGYKRRPVGDADRQSYVFALSEHLLEAYDDEYGDPNGNVESIDEDDFGAVAVLLRAAVDKFCDAAQVWACDKVAQREYTADEIMEIIA